jgi:hypothetical protein
VRWGSRCGFGRAWVRACILLFCFWGRWVHGVRAEARRMSGLTAHGSRLTVCCIDWIYLLDGPQPAHRRTLAQVHAWLTAPTTRAQSRRLLPTGTASAQSRDHDDAAPSRKHLRGSARLQSATRPTTSRTQTAPPARQPSHDTHIPTTTVSLVPQATAPAGTTHAPRAWQLQ